MAPVPEPDGHAASREIEREARVGAREAPVNVSMWARFLAQFVAVEAVNFFEADQSVVCPALTVTDAVAKSSTVACSLVKKIVRL